MSLSVEELSGYLSRQLNNFLPDDRVVRKEGLMPTVDKALERLEYCFARFHRKDFCDGHTASFNHLQSDQYAMFLYLLSNTIYRANDDLRLGTKIYYLNKILHGIDVYFEVELPNIFLFRHCVGTVLGRAKYGNYFSVGQNCTVGNNKDMYPEFKERVAMYNGSIVVGKCTIGPNSHISAQAFIRDQDVPRDSVVFGRSPNLVFKPATQSVYDTFFNRF